MYTGKSEIHMSGQEAGSSGKICCCSLNFDICREVSKISVTVLRRNFLSRKPQCWVLKSLTYYMAPTHVIKSDILHLKSTDCRC